METKSLIIGTLLTTGVFAFKVGAGQYYVLQTLTGWRRWWTLILIGGVIYPGIFLSAALLIQPGTALLSFLKWQRLMQFAILLHVVLALGMGLWAVRLLKRPDTGTCHSSSGWLLLALPCPVCLTVLVLTTAFLRQLWPEQLGMVVGLNLGVFTVVQLGTLLLFLVRPRNNLQVNNLLGGLMLLLSAYFLVSACLMPQIAAATDVLSLAQNVRKTEASNVASKDALFVVTICVFAISSGIATKLLILTRSETGYPKPCKSSQC